MYVHCKSNHPPSIIKNIPESINRRLSTISSTPAAFTDSAPAYQKALDNSDYKHKLQFNPAQQTSNNKNTAKKRSRHRKIIWFNPPYSANVATNVGKKFLNLIDTSFPPRHPLYKLLNRNTVKISYSCMANVGQIISAHNKSVLKKRDNENVTHPSCNCRQGKVCPLDGNCLTTGIVYQAIVTREDNQKQETYIGLTDTSFKTRFNAHTCSFRNHSKRHATALSKYIWTLKDNNVSYNLQWKIIDKGKSYSPSSKMCSLCIKEKYYIICKPNMSSLNCRNELASVCRHRRKYLLCCQ